MAATTGPTIVLPVWAKVLLVVFIAGLIGIITLFIGGAAWVANLETSARDPQRMSETAAKLARFQKPLPAGFTFDRVTGIFNIVLMGIKHDPDHSYYYLYRLPLVRPLTAKQLAVQTAKESAGLTKPMVIDQEGTEPVAGEEMSYVLGRVIDPVSGGKEQEFVGVTLPKSKKNEMVLLVGLTPGDHYNMEATKQLLGAIQSFQ